MVCPECGGRRVAVERPGLVVCVRCGYVGAREEFEEVSQWRRVERERELERERRG